MNDSLDKKYRALLFDVRRSVRYHSRRVGFYDHWHQFVLFVSLLLGSMTVALLSNVLALDWPTWMKLLPAAAVSVFTATDLIIGSSQKARRHDHLMREFVSMERSLEAGRNEPTETLITEVTELRLSVEATEPPILRVLDVLCHNELVRAMGYEKSEQYKVSFWQRQFAPFFDFREDQIG